MSDVDGGAQVRRPVEAGPPLGVVAGIALALAVLAVGVPWAMAGRPQPGLWVAAEVIHDHVVSAPESLRASSLLQFAASVPLAILSASAVARLHALGVRAAGPMIGLAGGVLASAALAVSACAQWVLGGMAGDADRVLLAAVHQLAVLAGGPWHVVALGLLVAGIAVSAAFHRLLPPQIWVPGTALAVLCELMTLAFLSPGVARLVVVARFGALLWLLAAGVLMPRTRPRRTPTRP